MKYIAWHVMFLYINLKPHSRFQFIFIAFFQRALTSFREVMVFAWGNFQQNTAHKYLMTSKCIYQDHGFKGWYRLPWYRTNKNYDTYRILLVFFYFGDLKCVYFGKEMFRQTITCIWSQAKPAWYLDKQLSIWVKMDNNYWCLSKRFFTVTCKVK